MNPSPFSVRCRQHGISLLEVLVAIVVLSLGVLGAVGMQAASMQSTKEVRHQAIAGTMARELAEKMRGNHAVAIAPTAAANPYLVDTTLDAAPISAPALNCYRLPCPLGTDIAKWDVYEWQLRLRDSLPSPRVRICMDATPFAGGGKPRWECSNSGDVAVLKLAWNRVNTKGELDLTSAAETTPLLVLPLTAGSSQ